MLAAENNIVKINITDLQHMTEPTLHGISCCAGSGKYRVCAELKVIGPDIIVLIWGGTRPHIGSVAAAVPRPSLKKPERMSATSSVLNYTGHKDEIISKLFSERLSAAFNCNCIATAGIHIDNATSGDVNRIMKNCTALCTRLQKMLEKQQ